MGGMGGLVRGVAFGAIAGIGAGCAVRQALRMRRECNFDGRIVLITDSVCGIGLSLAREFARQGAHIALCAHDTDDLARAGRELEAEGIKVFVAACDTGDAVDVERMVRSVIAHYGRIDVLVNGGGTIVDSPVNAVTDADYAEAMRTHFWTGCGHRRCRKT